MSNLSTLYFGTCSLLEVTFWRRLQYAVKDTSYCLVTNNFPKAQIFKVFICRGGKGGKGCQPLQELLACAHRDCSFN